MRSRSSGQLGTSSKDGHSTLFHLTGVYEKHPVADTAYQAMAMRLFGADAWGWRFGEVLVLAAVAAMISLLGTLLFDRLVGVAAAVVVGDSHYLMAFTRIAYNNLHALFWSTLVILLIVLAWRTRRVIFTWFAGCAVGLCLYTFSVALLWAPPSRCCWARRFFADRPDARLPPERYWSWHLFL